MTDTTDQQAVTVAQEGRPISEHPCHGLFSGMGDKLSHRHWFQANELMPTCERCGTPIGRDHKETGPVSWVPEKRRETVTLDDRYALSNAAINALAEWLAWPDAGRDGPREVTVSQTLSFLRGLPNTLGYGKHAKPPEPVPATNQAAPKFTEEWCLKMAALEGNAEIGAGSPDHPLRCPPATNQAGEALALIREMADPDLQGVSISLHRTWQKQALRIAALATHAATSQEGEAVAWCSPGQLANLTDVDRDGEVYLPIRKTKRGNFTMPLFAATPTPPTLSEDLRVLIGDIAWTADDINGRCGMTLENDDVKLMDEYFAALAQVKAS